MTPEQYSPLALRTARRFDAHGDFIHAALGLASEITELKNVIGINAKVQDEGGDHYWYLNLAAVSLKVELQWLGTTPANERLFLRSMDGLILDLEKSVSELADMAKKLMISGKFKRPDDVVPTLSFTYRIVTEILARHGVSMGQALHTNIIKLSERYPELKFEAERALNVNHEAEAAATRQCTPNQIAESSDDGQCCGKCSNVTGAA
jgi:hypothetical protein